MNTPNPLIPQGSLERQSKGKSTVRIAIFTIVSIHAVFFAGLLMQGCRRDDTRSLKTADAATNQNTLPPIDAGYYSGTQEVSQVPAATSGASNVGAPIANDPISTLPPASKADNLVEGKPYTVAKGDTLAKIARANGITVGALSKANPGVDPAKLHQGQKIQIPAAAAPAAAAGLGFKEPSGAEPSASGGAVYTVKPGETLTRIAKQHGVSVKALRAANSLKTDRVLVGQKLKLPAARTARASGEPTKTASVTKLTATNPAHVNPVPGTAADSNMR